MLSPSRQEATEPTTAVRTVPEPAPFQAAVAVIAARVRLAPPSPSVTEAAPRLSTMTTGALAHRRRGERST
jgi:hypothetical protein